VSKVGKWKSKRVKERVHRTDRVRADADDGDDCGERGMELTGWRGRSKLAGRSWTGGIHSEKAKRDVVASDSGSRGGHCDAGNERGEFYVGAEERGDWRV